MNQSIYLVTEMTKLFSEAMNKNLKFKSLIQIKIKYIIHNKTLKILQNKIDRSFSF